MIPVLVVVAVALGMIGIEVARPGRSWPKVAGWWTRAIGLNASQAGIAWVAGVTWDRALQDRRPWSAEGLGVVGGAVVGYLAITLVYYAWHRARHEIPFLWRWLHQMHHSSRRIEVITAFYKHPLEHLANGILSSAIVYVGVGLGPEAGTGAILLSGLAELFYHWNVRTPHWLGYLIQRPESHCIHHQEGIHAFNYADLPIWDMLFGTFRNPRDWNARAGFGPARERRFGAMLRGVDVHAPPAP